MLGKIRGTIENAHFVVEAESRDEEHYLLAFCATLEDAMTTFREWFIQSELTKDTLRSAVIAEDGELSYVIDVRPDGSMTSVPVIPAGEE